MGEIKEAPGMKDVADEIEKLGEDHPAIKELITFDEEYMKLEREYAKEWTILQAKYEKMQKPWLEKRKERAAKDDIKNFWLKTLQGHPIFNEEIQPWDAPVLECLKDIRTEKIDDDSGMDHAGFRIIFEFGENEFFTNTELTRVYETGLESEFLMEVSVKKIYMVEDIEWKVGKDVTVEMKKPKGGAKSKNKKPKKEPRDSFFRTFFRTIDLADPEKLKDLMDRTLKEMGYDPEEAEDDEEMEQAYEDALEKVNDDAYEYGLALRDAVVPYAVRWYTGQAMPKDDDDDDVAAMLNGDDSDDDDEDHDEDEDSDEEEASLQGSPKGKKEKEPPKDLFKANGDPQEKVNAEECKQQ